MCNNCNGNFPGLLNIIFGRNGCGCNGNTRSGCGCGGNNGPTSGNCGCGNYDAYYAAQYALNGCGCNSYGTVTAYNSNGQGGGNGYITVSSCSGCNNCGCSSGNGCGCNSSNYYGF